MIVLFDNMQSGWSSVLLATSRTDILAIPFVVTQDCTLTQVLLPLSQPTNRKYTHTVRLYDSSSSDPSSPGSVLHEWSDVSTGLASLAPATPVHLSAGSRYFLASFGNARSFVWDLGWHVNAAEERSSLLYSYDDGGTWLVFDNMWMPALRVIGETSVPAVPEPATVALGALGLAAAMRRRRR
ncbi:MAG: PEP-CTERM sorting domain-containing protein [Fimbriimonadales bacterium]|nr:PEP-CTERM sorting domain-containing protein [Fimbriimonadales bacterium]